MSEFTHPLIHWAYGGVFILYWAYGGVFILYWAYGGVFILYWVYGGDLATNNGELTKVVAKKFVASVASESFAGLPEPDFRLTLLFLQERNECAYLS